MRKRLQEHFYRHGMAIWGFAVICGFSDCKLINGICQRALGDVENLDQPTCKRDNAVDILAVDREKRDLEENGYVIKQGGSGGEVVVEEDDAAGELLALDELELLELG